MHEGEGGKDAGYELCRVIMPLFISCLRILFSRSFLFKLPGWHLNFRRCLMTTLTYHPLTCTCMTLKDVSSVIIIPKDMARWRATVSNSF